MMVAFINVFLTYFILVLASIAIIVLAVYCGKKLRDYKDKKDAANVDAAEGDK